MKFVYDLLFRRTSTYFVGIMASVFFFERAFDLGSEAIYDNVNRGVSYIMFRKLVRMFKSNPPSHFRNNGRTSNTSTNKRKDVTY